jgi:homocitrate synthase NifV
MGKHSGLAAIAASLSELKLRASSRELPAILARVREHAIATKTTVTAEVLAGILAEIRHAALDHYT